MDRRINAIVIANDGELMCQDCAWDLYGNLRNMIRAVKILRAVRKQHGYVSDLEYLDRHKVTRDYSTLSGTISTRNIRTLCDIWDDALMYSSHSSYGCLLANDDPDNLLIPLTDYGNTWESDHREFCSHCGQHLDQLTTLCIRENPESHGGLVQCECEDHVDSPMEYGPITAIRTIGGFAIAQTATVKSPDSYGDYASCDTFIRTARRKYHGKYCYANSTAQSILDSLSPWEVGTIPESESWSFQWGNWQGSDSSELEIDLAS